MVSPTGIVYEPGTPPVETRPSQTATLYLRQERLTRALELALEGLAADPENPIHFFLAGVSYARLREYQKADAMFSEAQRIYPAYELDIESEREAAWAGAFNAGLEAYQAGDVEQTIEVWGQAALIHDLQPEAHRNLASLLAAEGRYREAVDVYQRGLAGLEKRPATRVLEAEELRDRAEATADMEEKLARLLLSMDRFAEAEPLLRRQVGRDPTSVELRSDLASALSGQGREAEALEIYSTLLSEESLQATQLFNLGVGLFRSADFAQAAEVFRRLTELQPNSRDAWFNYANSLFAGEVWPSLAVVGDRLVELDPLSENAWLITARAQMEIGERQAALGSLELVDAAPVYVDGLQLRGSGAGTSVQGRITGNTAESGTPVRLRFTFYGDAGAPLGTETLTVAAPAAGESLRFDVSFAQRASAYRYELLR